jgi:nitrile hydratase
MTRFAPGWRVRAAPRDPSHHTRIPRYVRGHIGDVVAVEGTATLPDDRARGLAEPRKETVYTVRFAARDLWGEGTHTVAVGLWESYLEEAGSE